MKAEVQPKPLKPTVPYMFFNEKYEKWTVIPLL